MHIPLERFLKQIRIATEVEHLYDFISTCVCDSKLKILNKKVKKKYNKQ